MKTDNSVLEKEVKVPFVFNPDESLLEFANTFSENYKKKKKGTYSSKDKKYTIVYDNIFDKPLSRPLKTFARIGQETGKIELNRSLLIKNDKITSDYIFYIILWCIVIHNVDNVREADKITIKYYFSTNRSHKNVVNGWFEQHRVAPTPSMQDRILQMINYLRQLIKKAKNIISK